jgi:hypothetical protein
MWVNRKAWISICALLTVGMWVEAVPAPGAGTQGTDRPRAAAKVQAALEPLSRSPTFAAVEARADSVAALNALLLVAQREGDLPWLLNSLSEKRRECRALQDELLLLMEGMDLDLARRGADLAPFLVEPPNLLQPAKIRQALRVVLPFIETIPESLPAFGRFCLAAGLMLREDGQDALAARYSAFWARALSGH